MASNSTLNRAKDARNDEFYTRYDDIQQELNHYEEHFKGKTVLCNCDDPFESNFCKFFLKNFNYLGLKRLICTSYVSSPVVGTQMTIWDWMGEPVQRGNGYVMDISGVPMANGRGVSDDDIEKLLKSKKRGVKKLSGDGDFRSPECIELLMEADIVVTNPPFSLFNDYMAQLVEYEKKFIVLGNPNAMKYKEIFPLFMKNKLWLGYKTMSSDMYFYVPDDYKEWLLQNKKEGSAYVIKDDEILGRTSAVWFTNLDIKKRHEKQVLYKKYNSEDYPKYDNFDAIEVSKVDDIPMDYDGLMGVPISFMDKYNPDQFEIVGVSDISDTMEGITELGQEWIDAYRSEGGTGHYTAHMKSLGFSARGKHKVIYSRIIIRKKV